MREGRPRDEGIRGLLRADPPQGRERWAGGALLSLSALSGGDSVPGELATVSPTIWTLAQVGR